MEPESASFCIQLCAGFCGAFGSSVKRLHSRHASNDPITKSKSAAVSRNESLTIPRHFPQNIPLARLAMTVWKLTMQK